MAILEVKELCKRFGSASDVLRGVNFQVEQGEFLAIIGLSGAGKSTLLRCINRLVEPTSGRIFVAGSVLGLNPANGPMIDIVALRESELRLLRRKIGMIFQQFNIVKRLSAIQNVLTGGLGYQPTLKSCLRIFSKADQARALMNLARVGLLRYAYRRADELSGGEQQRVAIARTLMQNPAIILADEPVSNLDPRLSRTILDILKEICLQDGITVVVSLHTLELARAYADRVVALRDGKVFFEGAAEDLSETLVSQVFFNYQERSREKE